MSTSFIRQQIKAGVNNLIQEVSKQLAKIVKPMVRNELQLFQEQQKEMLQTHGQSIEATHVNAYETISEMTTHTKGRASTWPSTINKRPSDALDRWVIQGLGMVLIVIGNSLFIQAPCLRLIQQVKQTGRKEIIKVVLITQGQMLSRLV